MDSSHRGGPPRKRAAAPPDKELDAKEKMAKLIELLQQNQNNPEFQEEASKIYDGFLQGNISNDVIAPEDIIDTFPPILFENTEKDDDLRIKEHQKDSISLIYKTVIRSGSGAIIAHFMGLGKTTTTVAFLYGVLSHPAFEKRFTRVLILSPYTVIPHWLNEFKKTEWKKSFGDKINKIKAAAFESAPSEMEDHGSLHRMQITAWYNNNEDIKIIIISYEIYIKPIEAGKCSDAPKPELDHSKRIQAKLYEKLKKVMHRKDESYLKGILTCKKKEITITLIETPKQKRLLDELTREYSEQAVKQFFQYRHHLNRIAAHPYIYQKTCSYGGSTEDLRALQDPIKGVKMIFLFEILNECIQNNEKLVVFAEYLETLEYIENQLKQTSGRNALKTEDGVDRKMTYNDIAWKKDTNYYLINGKTGNYKRDQFSKKFNDPHNNDARLFLLSTRTASVGISLIGATRMILFDHGFNPANNTQAVYRIYRIGQTRDVTIYRFEIKNCDDSILRNQITKLIQITSVVDGAYKSPQYSKLQLINRRNICENQIVKQISDQRILDVDDDLLRAVITKNNLQGFIKTEDAEEY
uniref:Helicase C-terminal domain-containing protein n=1 Tax=Panagrolaimus sp. PS1159 TaxID=55785 RepID=A0AC35F8D3_9BILA